MNKILCVLFYLIQTSINAQTFNTIKQLSTTGNDEVNFIRLNDYWGTIVSGNMDGYLPLTIPTQYTGCFMGLFDSIEQAIPTGDYLPPFELNSKINTPPFVIGNNDHLFICGFAFDTIRFGTGMGSGGIDSVTFIGELIQGGWGAHCLLADNLVIVDMANNKTNDIILAGKILNISNFFGCNTGPVFTPYGAPDIIVIKLDSNKSIKWIKEAGGIGLQEDAANGVAVDFAGNIYVCGHIHTTALFDSIVLAQHDTSEYDGFIAKYDTSGIVQWVKYAGYDALDVAADSAGNCYVAGYAIDSSYFDTTLITSNSSHSMFLSKFDTNGNLEWVKSNYSNSSSQINSLKIDRDLYCYATGKFSDSLITGSGVNLYSSTCVPDSNHSAFIICYDTAGIAQWGKSLKSCSASSSGMGLDVKDCKIAFSGFIENSPPAVYFDNDSIVSNGGTDGFYTIIDTCMFTTQTYKLIDNNPIINIFPNPASSEIRISAINFNDIKKIVLYDLSGRIIEIISNTNFRTEITINLETYDSGVYLCKIIRCDGSSIKKKVCVAK